MPDNRPDQEREVTRALGLVGRLGVTMVLAILAGFGGGYLLDARFGTAPWLMIACTVAGIAGGFYLAYRIIMKVL